MASRPLQWRITIGMLALSLAALWSAAFWLSHALRQDMEATISAQQFSTVSLIATELDRSIRERQDILQAIAHSFSSSRPESPAAIQNALDRHPLPERVFNWGILVLDQRGVAIASVPRELQRVGVDFSDYPGVREALDKGVAVTTDPLFSQHSQQPLIAMATAIRGQDGVVRGAVIGVTNLSRPNFLDEIGTSKYGMTGDFLITAPATRTYVASSDRRRVMKNGPARGINAVYDKYIDGYEGSGVARSSRGVVELSSSKRIPATGWLMQSVLPVDEAFAPIQRMQQHLFLISGALTLLAAGLGAWWLRRQFRPLAEAAELLTGMREGRVPRQPLPVHRNDEIGLLTDAFNRLQQVIIAEEGKAAERAADRRLRRVVACVPGVVFEYHLHPDGHGSFPFASDGIRQVFGLAPEDVADSTEAHRRMIHPDDYDRFFSALHAAAGQLTPWRIEYRIITADGSTKWLLAEAVPEAGENGIVIFHGFIADITATKTLEAEIASYRDHLEQLVAARTADLEQARAEAEQLARIKSEFLAKMSHEIRTPLHGILGLARIGQKDCAPGGKADDAFTKINHAGTLLLGILNDVLDFSKMEAGMLKIDETDVQLAPLLEESVEMMQEGARAKGLALQLVCSPDLPAACRTDALRLRQILLNLLSNGIKFTPSGSVRLEAAREGSQLVFRIVDTGIGITPEQRAKIFRPFEQGDNTTTRRFGGTGLGLAITEHIVRMMGGSISVESRPGAGSCFEVRLPCLPSSVAPALEAPATTPSPAQPLAGLRILVAEDVEINQEIMAELLSDFGAEAVVVANGREAVERVRSGAEDFAAVLMDIQMPVMNGYDATREIVKLVPGLPIIGQTAHALAEERAACLACGMVGHIAKPIDPDELAAVILRHARRHPVATT